MSQHEMEIQLEEEIERLRAENRRLREILGSLRKSTVGFVWRPLGDTGDESDWWECALCGSRTRSINALKHTPTCVMSITEAVLSSIPKAKS